MGNSIADLRVQARQVAADLRGRGFQPAEPWGWRLWSQGTNLYEVIARSYESWSDIEAIWLAPDGTLRYATFEGDHFVVGGQPPTPSTAKSVRLATDRELEKPDHQNLMRNGPDSGKKPGVVPHCMSILVAGDLRDPPGTFLRKALTELRSSGADKFQGNSQNARRSRRQDLARQRIAAERRPALQRIAKLTKTRTKAEAWAEGVHSVGDFVAWCLLGFVGVFVWGVAIGIVTLVVYWRARGNGYDDGGSQTEAMAFLGVAGYFPAFGWRWIAQALAKSLIARVDQRLRQEERQLARPRYEDPGYVWSDAADDWVKRSGATTAQPKHQAPAAAPASSKPAARATRAVPPTVTTAAALGGRANVVGVTRRGGLVVVTVTDPAKVDRRQLRAQGTLGMPVRLGHRIVFWIDKAFLERDIEALRRQKTGVATTRFGPRL